MSSALRSIAVAGRFIVAQSDGADTQTFWDRVADFFTSEEFIASVVIVIGAVILWWIIRSQAHRAVQRLVRTRHQDDDEVTRDEGRQRIETLWVVIRRLLLVTLLIVTVLTILAVWGVPIGPLMAFGGVLGIAVGFGTQSLVKDVLSGFFILAENQFSVGDVVRFSDNLDSMSGIIGTVEDIRPRVTVLRDLESNVHYVPNGSITVATNLTQERSQVVLDVGIAYGEDVDRALAVVADEAERFYTDPDWADEFLEEPQLLGVNELADWSVQLRVMVTARPGSRWTVKREFLRRIKNRLDAEGIEIPFPYTTLVPGDPARWQAALGGSGGAESAQG
jgi:small conductance mechanosensitive channel